MRREATAAGFVLAALFFAAPASAAGFALKDGTRVEGEVLSEKSTFYRIRRADGVEDVIFKSDLAGSAAEADGRPAEDEPAEPFSVESAARPEPAAAAAAADPAPPAHVSREWFSGAAGYRAAVSAAPGRAIALYFSAPWCGYCKVFDRQILNSAKVKDYLNGVPKVKLNGDKEAALMKQFEVTGYPTFLVVRKDGDRQRIRTGSSPEEFIQDCKGAGLGT